MRLRTRGSGRSTATKAAVLTAGTVERQAVMTLAPGALHPEQITTIRKIREAGATWRAIGAATGRSHVACRRLSNGVEIWL